MPQTFYSKRYKISKAIDTMQMLSSGLISYNPRYPSGRGKSGEPMLLEAMWIAGLLDKARDGYYMTQSDTIEKAQKTARELDERYWKSQMPRPRMAGSTIIRIYQRQ